MKKFVVSLLALFAGVLATNAYALNAPTLNVGDQYVTNEELRLEATLLGDNGFILINMEATYEVAGETSITHERSGSTTSYDVIELAATGTLSGTGNVNITNPLPINGPARVVNGQYEASVFVDSTTFATVKKTRSMRGTAEYQLPNGQWFAIGALVIGENEEYNPPLPEIPFPVTSGSTGSASSTVTAFGDISAAGLITTDFEVPVDLAPTYTTFSETLTINGSDVDTIRVEHTDATAGVNLTVNYACEANNTVYYEITNLPLGDNGTLKYIRVETVEFAVSDDSCGGGGSPSVTLTSPKLLYTAGEAVKWDLNISNPTSNTYNTEIYVLLDILGSLYFLNYTTLDLVEYPGGITSNAKTIAPGSETITLLSFPSFPAIGFNLTLNWYAGVLDLGNGQFWQPLANVSTTHP